MRLLRGRERLPWYKDIKTIIVPKKGWWRLLNYFWHRIGRLTASPYNIAAGLACGVSICFTPFIGLHMIIAIAIAAIIRGNLVAAAIGTFFGTPWTLPLIWLVTYHSGVYFMDAPANEVAPLDLLNEDGNLWNLFTSMFMNINELFLPMLIGSIPFVLFAWFGTFALCYLSISKYKTAMAQRRNKIK